MRIFFDTNFLLDFLVREDYRISSQNLILEIKKRKDSIFISYLSVANFAYIARKLPKENLYDYLKEINTVFQILSNDKIQIKDAIELFADDFEDALQYQTAINGACDCIITRNQKDFEFSSIPVYSPSEFLANNLK